MSRDQPGQRPARRSSSPRRRTRLHRPAPRHVRRERSPRWVRMLCPQRQPGCNPGCSSPWSAAVRGCAVTTVDLRSDQLRTNSYKRRSSFNPWVLGSSPRCPPARTQLGTNLRETNRPSGVNSIWSHSLAPSVKASRAMVRRSARPDSQRGRPAVPRRARCAWSWPHVRPSKSLAGTPRAPPCGLGPWQPASRRSWGGTGPARSTAIHRGATQACGTQRACSRPGGTGN